MTSPAIEAKSLSTLTALASNPPAYPRNPTHGRHDPLVLYIARVPGSRDVFLTPMKPRDRVVTAEDVQSSLYYIHIDQPEDTRLIEPPPEPGFLEGQSASQSRPPVPSVQRKAVPAALTPGVPNLPARKPLPGPLAPTTDFETRQNVHANQYLSTHAARPEFGQRLSVDSIRYHGENIQAPPALPPRRHSEQLQIKGASLTLIRRDPATSAQWNVATIEDPPVFDVSSTSTNDPSVKKGIGAPVYIEITNPGYSKFLHTDQNTPGAPATRTNDSSIRPQNQMDSNVPGTSRPVNDQPTTGKVVFRRRLWMEGARYTGGGFGHRKNSSYDSSLGSQSPRASFDAYRPSMELRPPENSMLSRDEQAYNATPLSDRQSGFRGYVFVSPWNGRCEFVTGAGGGSLKCRHIIPGLQGAPPMAMPVSELRFNLPTSSKASTPRAEDSKRSSFFHRPRHGRNHSSVSDVYRPNVEDVGSSLDRMDLSLGQEFAGGGFGGRQAKLGKLIIEDEGLKMVDLLVATNLALWWRAYERVDVRSRND
ncbi:hypothetical protein EJ04DRAFT_549103 [Polyplosphaeria fusca]|uniref:Oxidoreductase-like protein n=1 Tax=Polyplosphaeria fusca TaxID=682080 RepID=A0A9P4R9U7_9PLEO|nr:hypothetical protein EJ04DRAFT_549103 [Polyplosphaeria fusca]